MRDKTPADPGSLPRVAGQLDHNMFSQELFMYYQKHIFFCTNNKEKANGCGDIAGDRGFVFAKDYLREQEQWGEGKFRASISGCLGRCALGPICVVYPDAVWYSYFDEEDVQEIIDEHLLNGQLVARLLLDKTAAD